MFKHETQVNLVTRELSGSCKEPCTVASLSKKKNRNNHAKRLIFAMANRVQNYVC